MNNLYWLKMLFVNTGIKRSPGKRKLYFLLLIFSVIFSGLITFGFISTVSLLNKKIHDNYIHNSNHNYTVAGVENNKVNDNFNDDLLLGFFQKLLNKNSEAGAKGVANDSDNDNDNDNDNAKKKSIKEIEEDLLNQAIIGAKNFNNPKGYDEVIMATNNFDSWPDLLKESWLKVHKKPIIIDKNKINELISKDTIVVYIHNYKNMDNGKHYFWIEHNSSDFVSLVLGGSLSEVVLNLQIFRFISDILTLKERALNIYTTQTKNNDSNQYVLLGVVQAYNGLDIQATLLFAMFMLVIGCSAIIGPMQAASWDADRAKGKLEYLAMVRAPTWFLFARNMLDYLNILWAFYFMLITTYIMIIDSIFNIDLHLSFLGLMILFIGFSCLNYSVNLFLMVCFQSVWGRILGRVMLVPATFLVFLVYRLFLTTEGIKILQGKGLSELDFWFGGVIGLMLIAVSFVVMFWSVKRSGKYRTAFAPLK